MLAIFAFSGALKAEAIPARVEETKPPQVSEIHGYRDWTKVNPQPVPITSELVAALCRAPTPINIAHDAQRSPHAGRLITVYVNELGRQAMMTERNPQFAVGSVIVKEKLLPDKKDAPELLTVMLKRERGYNPASGDWEYMVINGAGTKIEARGKLENCQGCHVSMKESGFVYRSYAPSEVRSKWQ
jgi:hypothetical protein